VGGGGGNHTITTLTGSVWVDGGAGDDRLVTGFDNDTVTGGPGRDTIFSDATSSFCGIFSCTVPFGNDTVNARDGEADTIDCGIGADRAVLDAIDTHANCETGLIDSRTFGARTLVTLALRVKRIPARGPVAIRVSNRNSFPITGRLAGRTAKRVSVSARRRLIKLKSKSFRVGPNARKTVKLRLPKSLQRLLRRKRKLTLRLSAKVKDPSGKSRTVTKKLTVRLKKPRGKR
jgi:hypothetical protein